MNCIFDYTYCIKDCQNKDCIHNKKHLEGVKVNPYKINWSDFKDCKEGD